MDRSSPLLNHRRADALALAAVALLGTFAAGAVNLALHLVNAALLYAVVRTAFRTPRLATSALAPLAPAIAFVASALFVSQVPLWTDAAGRARSHYDLGVALARAHREEDAIQELLAAIRIDPHQPPAYEDLALAYQAIGRTDEAEHWLAEDVRLAPNRPEAYAALGALYYSTGRAPEAIEPLTRAVALKPDAKAYVDLSGALNQMGKFNECVDVLMGAWGTVGGSAEAHFNIGVAYAALKDDRAAEREAAALDTLSPPLATQLRAFMAR